jgi:integrase
MSNFRAHEWEPLLCRAGMEDKYNFHLLRHAAASLFIAYLNWTPKRIQTVMGHSSVQMTSICTATCSRIRKLTARLWRG